MFNQKFPHKIWFTTSITPPPIWAASREPNRHPTTPYTIYHIAHSRSWSRTELNRSEKNRVNHRHLQLVGHLWLRQCQKTDKTWEEFLGSYYLFIYFVYRLTAEINTIKANCDNGDDNTGWKTHFGTSNFSFFWPKPPEQVQIRRFSRRR